MNSKKFIAIIIFLVIFLFSNSEAFSKAFSFNYCECRDKSNKISNIQIHEIIAKINKIELPKNATYKHDIGFFMPSDSMLDSLFKVESMPDARNIVAIEENDFELIPAKLTVFDYCKVAESFNSGSSCQEKALMTTYYTKHLEK